MPRARLHTGTDCRRQRTDALAGSHEKTRQILNSVELEVSRTKISGDPTTPDLRMVLEAYYSMQPGVETAAEVRALTETAIERIVNQAVESIRAAQAPRSVVMTGLVPYVRA